MKKNIIALAVISVISFMSVSAANASTYSDGTSVEVFANVVTPTTTTAQFTPAADSFTTGDLKNGATIGTVTITTDAAPTGWWFSVPSDPFTAESKFIKLTNSTTGGFMRTTLPENWKFSGDNGGIMWTDALNKPTISFDLKSDPAAAYNLAAGKYSVTLNVGTYIS
ncbi:hypothetical protein [Hafnia paralvei]|uniref:hypothetical protein n=1 Tax=Hafnia paralvei TaxID=546367 RepID=UPI001419909A|nr:hypothetical protein [Hafnia paralvei]NIH33119.1 hypothetical protein [Hafnia paralvei]